VFDVVALQQGRSSTFDESHRKNLVCEKKDPLKEGPGKDLITLLRESTGH
jgi:hypothetical protein